MNFTIYAKNSGQFQVSSNKIPAFTNIIMCLNVLILRTGAVTKL